MSDLNRSDDWKREHSTFVVYLTADELAAVVGAVKLVLDGQASGEAPDDVLVALRTGLSELEGTNDA